jgi:hypothetical protein
MLGWDWYGFEKKNIGTRYVELVFLHPAGSTGRVVHFGASRAQNIDALFFMLLWDRDRFDQKSTRKCYTELVFLHPVGSASPVVHFGASEV